MKMKIYNYSNGACKLFSVIFMKRLLLTNSNGYVSGEAGKEFNY